MNSLSFLQTLAEVDPNNSAYQMGYTIGTVITVILLLAIPVFFIVSIIKYAKTKSGGWLAVMILTGLPVLAFMALFAFGMYQGFTKVRDSMAEEQVEGSNRSIQVQDSPLMVTIPDHWKMLTLTEEDDSLQMGNLYREEYVLASATPESDFVVNAKGFSDLTVSGLLSNMGDGEIVSENSYQVNGMDVFATDVHGVIDGLNISYMCYIIDGQEHFYQVITWTLDSKRDKAFPVFDAVVKSASETVAVVQ